MGTNPGYYQNSHLANPPVGSIMRYLGATDPDGWIICNGTARTNNQDGRYNALNSLGIGPGGSGISNYTPPNLQDKFLIGASSTYPLNSTGGNTTITLNAATTMPSHTHGMQHQHFVGAGWGTRYEYLYGNYGIANAGENSGGLTMNNTNYLPTSGPLVFDTSSSQYIVPGGNPNINNTRNSTDATGSGNAFSIIPVCIAVNYIIKY
jgi:hypothetical protein